MEDDDCKFFQKMADAGHYGVREYGKSRQGIYICTADGQFLASINNLDSSAVLETMKSGLRKWKMLPMERRKPKPGARMETRNRWEPLRPTDGLVLTVYSRDLHHRAKPESRPLKTWNVDSAWFSRDEMTSLIPPDAQLFQSFKLPDSFVSRICKLHLVDTVKGQTDAFKSGEISGSEISAKVLRTDDSIIELEISGSSEGIRETGQYARGVITKIIGEAIFDKAKNQFTRFDMVAIGKRWGKTRFNDRVAQQGESPIGFEFHLTTPDEPVVIPGIIWSYDAPWLKLAR